MNILRLIASRNFITVNKDLMRLLGLDEAVLLGELASEYEYWYEQDKLDGGWFYSTVENVEKNTTLKKHRQKEALDNLQRLGIVKVTRKGLPAKRYIKINDEKLMRLFDVVSNKLAENQPTEKKSPKRKSIKSTSTAIAPKKQLDENDEIDADVQPTSWPKISQLDGRKSAINKNKEIIINNNKYIYSPSADESAKENTKKPSTKRTSTVKILTEEFKELWNIYPNKKGKSKAFELYKKARKNGTTFEEIKRGVENYNKEIRVKKTDPQFIKHGDTWFRNRCWEDDYVTDNGTNYDLSLYEKTMDTFVEKELPGATYL